MNSSGDSSAEVAARSGRHPIFQRFQPYAGPIHGSFWTDFLGLRARRSFHANYDEGNGVGYLQPHVQPITNEYFEWISLLCSVAAARHPFTMFELGSGWGRWLLRGALACKQLGKDFHLVGVEADCHHFDWMKTAFLDNGLDPSDHLLVNAAVGGNGGEGWFMSGNAQGWYGQSLLAPDQMKWAHREVTRFGSDLTGHEKELTPNVQKVKVIPLTDLLDKYPRAHLLNMDVQNAEADIVEAAAGQIDARVELAHISTHSTGVEKRLRAVFSRLGWIKVFDFAGQGQRTTPYGEVGFVDGVQTWINPTAGHVLDWFCDPCLLHFCATQNCFLQQQSQHDQDLHALEVRCLDDQLQTAIRQKVEADRLLEEVRQEKDRLCRERDEERNNTVLRRLARRFPHVAKGAKLVLRPLRGRKSA